MSEYMNNNELFIEPVSRQYGNHMVMTNVHKPQKHKYVNIDTQFSDEYNYQQSSNYNITLPERITDVKQISVTNIELPITFYNISDNFGNNIIHIQINGASTIITIPDNNYDINTLLVAITNQCTNMGITFAINGIKIIINCSTDVVIDFGVNEKYNFKSKLGWLLGFRRTTYHISSSNPIISENMFNLSGPRYLYLAIDEFSKSNQNTFVSPLSNSMINKNILARISMDMNTFPFGTILPANTQTGHLVSDMRTYSGKIDLHKLNVQLLNEYGNPIILNGMDFSFCLEIINE
jgi:hypothetical protein